MRAVMAQNYRLGLNNQFHPTNEDRPDFVVRKKPLLTATAPAKFLDALRDGNLVRDMRGHQRLVEHLLQGRVDGLRRAGRKKEIRRRAGL
jgi:hypothetical protein